MSKFRALQCFNCRAFQVKQLSSSRVGCRWSCSICSEKQAMRKVFFSSDSAREVRGFVQKANMARGLSEEAMDEDCAVPDLMLDGQSADQHVQPPSVSSKWHRYLGDEDFPVNEYDGEDEQENSRYVTSLPNVRQGRVRTKGAALNGCKRDLSSISQGEAKDMDLSSSESDVPINGTQIEGTNAASISPWRDASCHANSDGGLSVDGVRKRGYAMAAVGNALEESRVFKREKPSYMGSKWGKYLVPTEDG